MSDQPTTIEDSQTSFVRPYVITAGRTVGEAGDIPIETLVVARASSVGLPPDYAAVIDLCSEPLSVAEIAVHIHQPIGVARVLVADLTASHHVEQHGTAASEGAAIVRRLLDGIRSL